MLRRLRSRKSAITFDVGAAGIRACQFHGQSGTPRLTDMLDLDLSPTGDGTIDPPALDPALMHRLVGQGQFAGQDVAIVLSPPDVQFYPLTVPDQVMLQSPDRIEQALKYEVAQQSRGDANEIEVRYWRLPTGRGQQSNVMAAVMPTAEAVRWCDELQKYRLGVRRIDVSPCALVRLAQQMWAPDENDLWGVLDLGLRHSTLTLVVGMTPAYIRSLSASAHQWTQQVAKAFEVNYTVAEQVKREHTVGADDGREAADESGDAGSITDMGVAFSSALRGSLQGLAQEVGRCFSYVMQAFPEQSVSRLLLAGGGANLGGLPTVLESELGIPVSSLCSDSAEASSAWARTLSGNTMRPRSAAALGAGILDLEAS